MGVQTADKALIYVLRPTMMEWQSRPSWRWMANGRESIAATAISFFTVTPGQHYFCSRAENHSVIALTVEAGKTYYLQQEIQMGVMKARTGLAVMDEAEAQKKLPKLNLSTWEAR